MFLLLHIFHLQQSLDQIQHASTLTMRTQYLLLGKFMWLHWIKLNFAFVSCGFIWFQPQFQLSAVQSFNESHVSEAGENGCYLSVLVSVGHLQVASSLELFSNQKSLNSQDSHDVRSAATQHASTETYRY